eukprot:GHRR01021161.1.p1 GENE.GHRR01021161.1~~GHRR01021161.1.p1  ORF type:complete len:136 (+),score=25.38 GHRR01021161.1:611-1018(+)
MQSWQDLVICCYLFSTKDLVIPDGTSRFPNLCLNTSLVSQMLKGTTRQDLQECGQEGQPCCFSNDPTLELHCCGEGLTCIATSISYGGANMYRELAADPSLVSSTAMMGICRFEPGRHAAELACITASVELCLAN